MDNKNNIFVGTTYRISVLTERLLRLEYNPNGKFEDRYTEFAINRTFNVPQFEVKENEKYLSITTKYFSLNYKKNTPFKGTRVNPASNLRVELLSKDKTWYYGHPEIRNYGGIKPSLNSEFKTTKGLYSIDGFSSFDDSNTRVINQDGIYEERNDKNNIDIYLFMYRDDYYLALKDYFNLTGYPVLLPKYAFGIWWSRDYPYKSQEIIDLVRKFDEKDIPLSVLLLDKQWHIRQGENENINKTNYEFNDLLIQNPLSLVSELERNNVKLGLNIDVEDGIEYKNKFGDGILVPYNALDVKFIKVLMSSILMQNKIKGIDIYWLDNRDKIQDIGIIDRYLNLSNDISERRRIVISRAPQIAPHRNGIIYTGRNKVGYDTLGRLPFFTARAANIGTSWISSDIAGYYGGVEDDELYIRHVQFGVFSPIFRYHSGESKFYKKEPWNRSISTYHIVKDYIKLRLKLVPYIYSEAHEYVENAIPLIRPLYYVNKEVYDEPAYISEYFFGSQFLISPITVKRDYMIKRVIHKFFLPDGIWYDYKTGKKYLGNNNHVGLYKKDEYPIFVKAGGIIPMNNSKYINNVDELNIMIFPGRNNTYELYEDDGKTYYYKQGYYCKTKICYTYSEDEINIKVCGAVGTPSLIPEYRKYIFTLRNTSLPNTITCTQQESVNFEYICNNNDLIITVYKVNTMDDLDVKITGNNLEISMVKKVEEELDLTISDLPIETPLKEKISTIIFSNKELKSKRIEIIKLKKLIPKEYFALILRLLEYLVEQ